MRLSLSIWVATWVTGVVAVCGESPQANSTSVDLGYEVHTPILNSTGNYYLFKNVPYAEQPIGDRRFQEPVLPLSKGNTTVNDGGSGDIKCIQGYPKWVIDAQAAAAGVNGSTVASILYNAPNQTESCLVLDVYVPVQVYQNQGYSQAPILVWTHGGGFTFGSKTGSGPIAGLLARSNGTAIIVSINYRLGMYGWLDGNDITANLGLYDQRLAFQWVKKYISKFGGSPDRITAMGESAGASSMVHHITASGGQLEAPFEQAVILSPAWQFNLNGSIGYDLALKAASERTETTVDSVTDLKALSAEQLKATNQEAIFQAGYGGFNFGPVVDGTYVPNYPQVLLAQGRFDHKVKLLIDHTSNESVGFTPPISTPADVRAFVTGSYPEASNETINYMLDTVWPDVLDGTYPWTTEFARAARFGTDAYFSCSARFLSVAFGNATYDSIFAYPPGYHAQDVPFVFFNGDTSTLNYGSPVNPKIAYDIQDRIMAFTSTGNPNYSNAPVTWPLYGPDAQVLKFTYSGSALSTDDLKNARCDWLQQALIGGLL